MYNFPHEFLIHNKVLNNKTWFLLVKLCYLRNNSFRMYVLEISNYKFCKYFFKKLSNWNKKNKFCSERTQFCSKSVYMYLTTSLIFRISLWSFKSTNAISYLIHIQNHVSCLIVKSWTARFTLCIQLLVFNSVVSIICAYLQVHIERFS